LIISFLKLTPSHDTTNANNTNTNNSNNHTTATTILQGHGDNTKRYDNNMKQYNNQHFQRRTRPATTFEEAFRDVRPRPNLEAVLMARHLELQAEAVQVRRARQEEEQADFYACDSLVGLY
jgi:hypothetical protein